MSSSEISASEKHRSKSKDKSKDKWNKSTKHSIDSIHSKTCVYRQVYNVNPMMGGFTVFGDSYDNSVFNSYSFTGEYKILAEGNYVKVITTESCSNMSVSFYKALVVFQPIVKPDTRYSECSQDVQFIENEYKIEMNPFEIYQITVGTMIVATNGVLHFTTWKLPSKTNQDKISRELYVYVDEHNEKFIVENVDVDDKLVAQETPPGLIELPPTSYVITVDPAVGTRPRRTQFIKLFTSFKDNSIGLQKWVFHGWYVYNVSDKIRLSETTNNIGEKGYKLVEGKTYHIGFIVRLDAKSLFVIPQYTVYNVYNPILNPGTAFVATNRRQD